MSPAFIVSCVALGKAKEEKGKGIKEQCKGASVWCVQLPQVRYCVQRVDSEVASCQKQKLSETHCASIDVHSVHGFVTHREEDVKVSYTFLAHSNGC